MALDYYKVSSPRLALLFPEKMIKIRIFKGPLDLRTIQIHEIFIVQ